MESIYDHVPSTAGTEIVSEGFEAPVEGDTSESKPPLVKIALDPQEGLTPECGRYSTFYNMYFINRAWCKSTVNLEKITKQFSSFLIVDLTRAVSSFTADVYGTEFCSWLHDNTPDYYLLLPIVTVRKNTFKFAGVHLPKFSTDRLAQAMNPTYTTSPVFSLSAVALRAVAAYSYGAWSTSMSYHSFITAPEHPHTIKGRVREYQKRLFEWLEFTPVGPNMEAFTTNNEEVSHA